MDENVLPLPEPEEAVPDGEPELPLPEPQVARPAAEVRELTPWMRATMPPLAEVAPEVQTASPSEPFPLPDAPQPVPAEPLPLPEAEPVEAPQPLEPTATVASQPAAFPLTPPVATNAEVSEPLPEAQVAAPANPLPLPEAPQSTPADPLPLPEAPQSTPADPLPLPEAPQSTPADPLPLPEATQPAPVEPLSPVAYAPVQLEDSHEMSLARQFRQDAEQKGLVAPDQSYPSASSIERIEGMSSAPTREPLPLPEPTVSVLDTISSGEEIGLPMPSGDDLTLEFQSGETQEEGSDAAPSPQALVQARATARGSQRRRRLGQPLPLPGESEDLPEAGGPSDGPGGPVAGGSDQLMQEMQRVAASMEAVQALMEQLVDVATTLQQSVEEIANREPGGTWGD